MSLVPSTSTSSPNFGIIFAAALKEYKEQTKKDIDSHPLANQLTSCDSPNAVLTVLQTQVQTFDRSESANEMWTKLLDPTVNVLYAFSGFVSNIAGPVFPPAAAIFTGIGVLLQAVKDVRATQDILIDLFGRMEFFFKRLEAYIKVRPTSAMTEVIVQIMVEVISILGIVTKEIKQGPFKRYAKKLFGIRRVEDAFKRLEKLTQEEVRMAQSETLAIAARIDKKVEGIDEGVTDAREKMQVVLKYVSNLDRNESRKDLRRWINPPDPSSNLDTASDAHHEGTAVWCTNGIKFADWQASGTLLWIYGKPGSGKTILSSVIIRHIKHLPNASSVFLAYFYFDFKDQGKKDSRALLSSLLDQLSNQSDPFRDLLHGLYSEHQDGSKQPHNDARLRCLKDMLTMARSAPVYLVIDALDECPNDSGDRSSRSPRGKVLSVVKELDKLRLPNLRLCITSRPEVDIRAVLKPLSTQEISLDDESGQNRDINAYVTSVVQSVTKWHDDDKKMVINKLTENADGMFQWVFCQLEVLRPCLSKNLPRTLEELPKSLDETYRRILKEINNANRQDAHRLLQCLTVARRPLRVEELAEVLALDVDAGGVPRVNEKWRWEDHEGAVLSACSSLVSVINLDGSRVVQFSHFSVQEFLTSDRLASIEDVSLFHIADEASHAILAQACLAVLLCLNDRTSEYSVWKIPLSEYVSEHWVDHTRVGKVDLQIKGGLDYFFDLDNPHFAAYIRIWGLYHLVTVSSDDEQIAVLPPAAPLCLAAHLGLSGLAERLIAKRPDLIDFCGQEGTPLHLSVQQGHMEVVQLLLARGADINVSSPNNITPLHIALREEHLEIGKFLLDCGADVNTQDKNGRTPLRLTAARGYFDVFQILLERKANMHVPDNNGMTPLHLAVYHGHLEITRLLLDHNVDVNYRDNNGSSPFLNAMSSGNLEIVQLLLDNKADAHVHDNSGNTPLHFAAFGGHLEVARLLLELNADVHSVNDNGSTPLHRATESERKEGIPDLVRLLVDNGADVHTHDNSGDTPLHFSAFRGHVEVTRMLLELNADANSLNNRGSTPLLRATQNRRQEGTSDIVSLLLDNGADIHTHDNIGDTPLHFAAESGHLEVVCILLKLKVDVNVQNAKGSTPLHRATRKWQQEDTPDIVRLLLDSGADVHTCDNRRNTPLHLAASEGQFDIVRMLIGLNAEVNSQNKWRLTPLHLAIQSRRGKGIPDVVRLLLDNGMCVHTRDDYGNTPLHLAASEGQIDVARMLIERNAEVNSLNDEGSTPLHEASRKQQKGILGVVQLLLDNSADVHMRDKSGNTPLHNAAGVAGYPNLTCMLLGLKVDVNSQNDQGLTPLHLAILNSRGPAIVRVLLDNGADVHTSDNSGTTPLHFAASPFRYNLEVFRMLLEFKATINTQNNDGSVPLHFALRAMEVEQPRNVSFVRLMLDNGADVQVHNKYGYTPLHLAAFGGYSKIACILIEHNAELNSRNDKGSTPFLLSLEHRHPKVARLLLDHNLDTGMHMSDNSGNTPLHFAALNGYLDICRILLQSNAAADSQNHRGSTPLLLASQCGSLDVVQLLLDYNADAQAHDLDGDTLLHRAAIRGHLEVAQLLLGLNADVNSQNGKGSTPLHLASAGYGEGSPEVVQLLLDHGADAQARNLSGEIASEVACGSREQAIVQLLSQHATE